MKRRLLVGGEGQAVWPDEVVRDDADLAGRAVDAEDVVAADLALGLVPFVVRQDAVGGIGEPDRSVRADHDVVRAVQPLAVYRSAMSGQPPSCSVRTTRRPPCSQVTRRP